MPDEMKAIDVVIGPYRGQRLTVSAADFDRAINEHWAVDPNADPSAEPHPPLSDDEKREASEAAIKWRDDQLVLAADDKPKEVEPKKAETLAKPTTVQRDLRPTDSPAQNYATRQTPKRET